MKRSMLLLRPVCHLVRVLARRIDSIAVRQHTGFTLYRHIRVDSVSSANRAIATVPVGNSSKDTEFQASIAPGWIAPGMESPANQARLRFSRRNAKGLES